MKYKRWSLCYLATYLTIGGFSMIFVPDLFFKVMHSNIDFGEQLPRFAGIISLALATLVVQVIRLHLNRLYPTILLIRCVILVFFLFVYLLTHNIFFILLILIGVGPSLLVNAYPYFFKQHKSKKRKHVG